MIRVLVAIAPRMYREAVALSIHRNRPGLDVRAVIPEEAEREIGTFRPHLLVHNDTVPILEEVLDGVPCRVEVLYSDSMNARVRTDGGLRGVRHVHAGPAAGGGRGGRVGGQGGGPGLASGAHDPASPGGPCLTSSMVIQSLSSAILAASPREPTPIFS